MCSLGCDIFIEEYEAPDCEGGKLDENTGLCWQHPAANDIYTLEQALEYCDSLTLGDSPDWRLPAIEEFFDLLGNCGEYELGVDEVDCNGCEESVTCFGMFGPDTSLYMSSTSVGYGVCVINLEGGYMNYAEQDITANVRCVRED